VYRVPEPVPRTEANYELCDFGSDQSVFYRCGISGYQDSLYGHNLRQFYKECKIRGTIDFIFGYATAVFQNYTILVKKGLPL